MQTTRERLKERLTCCAEDRELDRKERLTNERVVQRQRIEKRIANGQRWERDKMQRAAFCLESEFQIQFNTSFNGHILWPQDLLRSLWVERKAKTAAALKCGVKQHRRHVGIGTDFSVFVFQQLTNGALSICFTAVITTTVQVLANRGEKRRMPLWQCHSLTML